VAENHNEQGSKQFMKEKLILQRKYSYNSTSVLTINIFYESYGNFPRQNFRNNYTTDTP